VKGVNNFHLPVLLKQYVLQGITFIDASIGPSFWIKIYYSFLQLSIPSIVLGLCIVCLFYKYFIPQKEAVNMHLLVAFILIVLFAFGIFSLTGYYPQIAFNLGNRVTIYGTFIITLFIVLKLLNSKKTATILFAILLFSMLGISDHWKDWNKTQLQIIDNISTNSKIQKFNKDQQLFVCNNQFSQYGDLSHIEFFSTSSAMQVFKFATNNYYSISPLNRRFRYSNDEIVDTKFGHKFETNDYIYVYDSKKNDVLKLPKNEIQRFIADLPKSNRHWAQLLKEDNIFFNMVISLMPRLKYLIDTN
ncbi:MAG: hypothetical protein GY699_04645, partial [Desulfobacteraceae bacterium]|nr:hypothetical protein [Desulfobacteraceae bacterium]